MQLLINYTVYPVVYELYSCLMNYTFEFPVKYSRTWRLTIYELLGSGKPKSKQNLAFINTTANMIASITLALAYFGNMWLAFEQTNFYAAYYT